MAKTQEELAKEIELWEGKLALLLDDAMRLGAALGSWVRMEDPSDSRFWARCAATAALKAGHAKLLEGVMSTVTNKPQLDR